MHLKTGLNKLFLIQQLINLIFHGPHIPIALRILESNIILIHKNVDKGFAFRHRITEFFIDFPHCNNNIDNSRLIRHDLMFKQNIRQFLCQLDIHLIRCQIKFIKAGQILIHMSLT